LKSDPEFSIVAIDGPAASGKSTVARCLARRLGFSYVNSGALYRAVAWLACEHKIPLNNPFAINSRVRSSAFELKLQNKELFVRIDGINPAPHLRDEEVNRTVSYVSAIPEVREFLVRHLREFLSSDDLVMEGRDIGSMVFPDTPHKFFIDASLEVRARRRMAQGHSDDLFSRDAHVIDSSSLTIDGVVGEIIGRLKIQGLSAALRLDS